MTTARKRKVSALIKRVLFATDFSVASLQALPFATRIVRQFQSKLHMGHIVPPEAYASGKASIDESAEAACREARLKLQALVESDVPHDISVEKYVGRGDIWIGLSDFVGKKKIDLTVMGTSGRSGIKKFLLGSVAEEAMRVSPCPVLTVGPEIQAREHHDFRRILYATDFSEESLGALRHAVSWSQQFNSRLILVHALERRPDSPYLDKPLARVRLAELVPQSLLGSEKEFVVAIGSPSDVILRAAEDFRCDLIVIGARGAGSVARLASHFGSVAHMVVARACCPVLTTRARIGGGSAGSFFSTTRRTT